MHCRPSDLYDITGSYRRFLFDRAVLTFGMALENALDEVEGDKKSRVWKTQLVLDSWLGRETQYRNPVATAGKVDKPVDGEVTMTMKGDGSWQPT